MALLCAGDGVAIISKLAGGSFWPRGQVLGSASAWTGRFGLCGNRVVLRGVGRASEMRDNTPGFVQAGLPAEAADETNSWFDGLRPTETFRAREGGVSVKALKCCARGVGAWPAGESNPGKGQKRSQSGFVFIPRKILLKKHLHRNSRFWHGKFLM